MRWGIVLTCVSDYMPRNTIPEHHAGGRDSKRDRLAVAVAVRRRDSGRTRREEPRLAEQRGLASLGGTKVARPSTAA